MASSLPVKMPKDRADDDNSTIVEWLHITKEEVNRGEILSVVELTRRNSQIKAKLFFEHLSILE